MSANPIIVQIMDRLCVAFGVITLDNGFYNDLVGVGIEPLAFGPQDLFPQIIVHEESGQVVDSRANGFQDSSLLDAIGFVKSGVTDAYRTAYKLRDDMTRVMRSITAETFKAATEALPEPGYVKDTKQLVTSWSIEQQREIVQSEIAEGFLEVHVRASVVYRDFSPPVPGI